MKRKTRFILIDDDPLALELTAKGISTSVRRAEILRFPTAKEAIAFMSSDLHFKKYKQTVLITDLHMPEMDGFSLLSLLDREFWHLTKSLHVFVLSAGATPNEVKGIFSFRCVIGFYSKPLTKENIRQIVMRRK